ncbi:S-layer family protein [Limnohabitans sp. 2KL-51]|uniref:beta strand repeat-containing protein n=1 Tax=Limnohabitans sp. 2KL-51 TaxID=1977911 RepID=UPI001E2C0F68|nr:Ig-like domain-containing protein [Limnohabitans sp. 2KL-51]
MGGTLIGTATVAPGGTTWEITDLAGYASNASWTYTAKVADAAGNVGTTATQVVNTDLTEAAPAITGVFDTASSSTTTIANNGTTTNALSSVKGTGLAGNTIFLYDNNYTTLVGSAVVDGTGNWSVTSLTGTFGGSNTFAAKQVDAQGNQSGLSNQWTVSLPNANIVANGDFSNGATGYTFFGALMTNGVSYDVSDNYIVADIKGMVGSKANTFINYDDITNPVYTGAPDTLTRSATNTSGQVSWYTDYLDLVDTPTARQRVGRTFESLAGTVGESNQVLTGNVWTSNGGTLHTILSTTVNVEAGKTYTFSYDYLTSFWSGNPWNNGQLNGGGRLAAVVDGVRMEVPYTLVPDNDAEITTGTMTATYTATATKAITIKFTGKGTDSHQYGDYALDNISFVESGASAAVSTFGTAGPTANPDTLSYTAGALDALGSNDTITVGNTSLQATLAAGGIINGGTGIDNLKLAAGTTLNLESTTGNQTVRPIEQVEMITLQGGTSKLTMSANNVLSLGGSNATTMAPYTFTSTTQGTGSTGSTTSTGKVQFVVNGQLNDVLNLSVLANDGVVSTNGASAGLLGNTDLAGSWAYKGTFSIAANVAVDGVAHVYKVYDHSTTGAQVLVDVDVTVNTISPITISAISTDAGTSATDFITNDQTLTYSGGLPAAFNGATERVLVEILNSANQVVSTGFATPSGTTWSWNNTTKTELEGNYTIRATIVGLNNTTAVAAYGAGASATHLMTIDLTPPQVAIARTDGLTTTVGSAGTQVSFTLTEASSDFTLADIEANGGTISNWVQSSTNPLVYTATFTPTANAAGTGYVRIASSKFMDAAGNNNKDTYTNPATGTDVYQANNLQSIPYDTLPPTQTVAFSSMTKDSGVTTTSNINSNWTTNDTSAGRLLSGTLSAPLDAGDVVKVYANGTLIGTATVAPGGKTWEITDTSGYSAGWTYTAQVVDSQNATGPLATQVVNADLTEAPPVITGVFDTASTTTIANNGTTTKALSSVKGTGVAGDTIYLYDNTTTTLVGSAVVDSSGNWSVTSLTGTFGGSNTFAAVQLDPQGNQSLTSNLWTVKAPGANLVTNGDFSAGETGFTTTEPLRTGTDANPANNAFWLSSSEGYAVNSSFQNYDFDLATTLAKSGVATAVTGMSAINWATDYGNASSGWPNPDSTMTGNVLFGGVYATNASTVWANQVMLQAGKTYEFTFDYIDDLALLEAVIGTQVIKFVNSTSSSVVEAGHFVATFTPTVSGLVDFKVNAYGRGAAYTGADGNYILDNLHVGEAVPANANTLVAAASLAGATANTDNLSYTAGALDALGSNDTITTTSTGLQAILAAGGMVDGGAGVDTLKLAAGTTLNLETLTSNQTVKPIQEVEIFQMQGTSSLTLSANDVLSLGGSNASTMAGYTFTSTTGGTASASSTGKVQMVITGTASDTLVLDPLMKDGVTTNGVEGNTGLAGQWDDMGTAVVGGVTYKVYNHSTTQAQVLTTITPTVRSNDIAFSSMTKDSGVTADATINSNWITNDTSAGRLISGTVATPLAAGDVVKVYANGTLIGNATVNAAGTAWEITDTAGYNASWVYSANIVSASGTSTTAYQPVNADLTEAPPVITGVKDAANAAIAHQGTTTQAIDSVSGTSMPGVKVYLYSNSLGHLVGTATADSSGNWTVSGLNLDVASNSFVAKALDPQGNLSQASNLWQVGTTASGVTNGDFELGTAGYAAGGSGFGGYGPGDWGSHVPLATNRSTVDWLWVAGLRAVNVIDEPTNITGTAGALVANNDNAWTYGTWSENVFVGTSANIATTGFKAFLGLSSGKILAGHTDASGGSLNSLVSSIYVSHGRTENSIYATEVDVVKGKTYQFSFDYYNNAMMFGSGERNGIELFINGVRVMTTNTYSAGHVTVDYVAPTDGEITVSLQTYKLSSDANSAFALDNVVFQEVQATDSNLGSGGVTPNPDAVSYSSGVLDTLAGNDTITVGTTALQSVLGTGGGLINGGAGVDTLKLAAGTSLDLMSLTANQTVKSIQQVEVFELQGQSSLTLTANDVLSLGGSNASTMAAYSFATTTQTAHGSTSAAGSTSSTGKVQFVVNATNTDQVVLANLATDGVTTNALLGNTGLAGQWDYKGTTSLTVNSVTSTYRVYDHSTTQAQVLIDADAASSAQSAGVSGGAGSGTGGTGATGGGSGSGSGSAANTNGVMITSLQASGTTASKVMTETFDGLNQYANLPMRTFITDSGMEFHWSGTTAPGNYMLGDVGSGLNGQGRALHVNGVYLSPSDQSGVFQIFQSQGNLTKVEFDYWDLNQSSQSVYTDVNLAGTDTSNGVTLVSSGGFGGTQMAPKKFSMNVSGASHLNDLGVILTSMQSDNFYMDNIKFTLSGVQETVDVANGGTTRYTTGVVQGTLASPLATGQKLEVFSGTTSMGFATVNGTQWTIADTAIAAAGEVYTAKILNADNSVVVTSSSYAVNPTAGATPKLTISDDATASVVGTGTAVNYTFAFDQAVTGFDAADVTVTGGTKGALTQIDSKTWVMTVTANATGAGSMQVSVADGAFSNSAGTVTGLGASKALAYDATAGVYKVEYFQRTAWGSATFSGTSGDDVMDSVGDTFYQGTVGGEKLYAGAGNDTVIIDQVNVTYLHQDTLGVTFDGFTRNNAVFDGGTGTDTLKLTGGTAALDLQNAYAQSNLKGFEIFDLLPYAGEMGLNEARSGDNYSSTIKVNLAGINAVTDSGVLTILGDSNDVVRISVGSLSTYTEGTTTLNGRAVRTFDLDKNGKIDLYVTTATGTVSVAAGAVTPLVLDLNGDGVQTTGLENPVSFDIDGDGKTDSTAWASGADGLLVMDLNGDGLINSGAELLGEAFVTPDGTKPSDGFAALATLDSNRDGLITASDSKFAELRLWLDANGNAVTDAGELKTLADFGIVSLNLNAQASTTENNGNLFGLVSSYTKQDGTQADLVDVWLAKGAEANVSVQPQSYDLTGPMQTDGSSVANHLQLKASDVLRAPVDASGKHVVQVKGDGNDTLNLSNVLGEEAPGQWLATGTVQQDGVTFNTYNYSADNSLQVMVDQHLQNVTLS